MTEEEFEQAYADRSGVSVEWLHENGRHAEPCFCDDLVCPGWQMVHRGQSPLVDTHKLLEQHRAIVRYLDEKL